MKHLVSLTTLFVLVIARLAAQAATYDPLFEPQFAASQALGNAGIASGTGFSSLYLNPAGLVAAKPTFTLTSASLSSFFLPEGEALGRAAAAWEAPGSSGALLSPFGQAAGFGGGAALGIGYTGSGLGLGLIASSELYAPPTGGSLGDASARASLAFVGGLGFKLGSHLAVGGDVRPMVRIEIPSTPVGNLLAALQNSQAYGSSVPALYGVGVGLDLGARLTYRRFSYGLALRDIAGTTILYEPVTLSSLATAVGSASPIGGSTGIQATIPMSLIAGMAFHPDLGTLSRIFDPSFEVDYQYSFVSPSPLLSQSPASLLLEGLRAGIDLRLIRFLRLRAGYEAGLASAGIGFHLSFVDVDATIFSRVVEVAPPGLTNTAPEQGATVGLTLHF